MHVPIRSDSSPESIESYNPPQISPDNESRHDLASKANCRDPIVDSQRQMYGISHTKLLLPPIDKKFRPLNTKFVVT